MKTGELSGVEREVLIALRRHQQTSPSEPGGWFAVVAVHVRSERHSTESDDVEREVIDNLEALELKGLVTRVGATKDGAEFPIYQLSSDGMRLLDRAPTRSGSFRRRA